MTSKFLVPLLGGTLLVAGCSTAFDALGPFDAPRGQADLRVETELVSGGLRTQAAVTPFTPADVELVILGLYKLDGQGGESPVLNAQRDPMTLQLSQHALGSVVTFRNLNANTTYRVKAQAFLDTNASQLISSEDASSSTDITLLQNDRPTLAKLKIQLIDKAFDGQGSSTLDIATGSLIPAGSESITVEIPG